MRVGSPLLKGTHKDLVGIVVHMERPLCDVNREESKLEYHNLSLDYA